MSKSRLEDGIIASGNLAFSITGFVDALGGAIGKTKVYEEIKTGRLKAHKAGKRTLITAEEGLAYVRSLPLIGEADPAEQTEKLQHSGRGRIGQRIETPLNDGARGQSSVVLKRGQHRDDDAVDSRGRK